MDNRVKFGIIGCSNVAKKTTIPAIVSSKKAILQRTGSRLIEKSKEFSSFFNCSKYGNYQDVLDDDEVDVVYISLPISLQEEWCVKAANRGKHVICEKSSSTSFSSAKRMVDAAKRNDVRIMEAFMFRFHPQHKKFMELLKSGIVGKSFVFEGKFGSPLIDRSGFRFNKDLGGGVLNDMGCYLVSASRMILEAEPYGVMSNSIIDEETGVDIHGSFYFIFPNDKVSLCSFGYENVYQSTYSVWGLKSLISVDRAFSINPNKDSTISMKFDDRVETISIPWVNQSMIMIDEFCTSILDKSKCYPAYEEDLLFQARAMEGIRISSKEKRFVKLDEIK